MRSGGVGMRGARPHRCRDSRVAWEMSPVSDASLYDLLRCPQTGARVSLAPPEVIAELEHKRREGELRNGNGERVHDPVVAALCRADGRVVFPVVDGIPIMLMGNSFAR